MLDMVLKNGKVFLDGDFKEGAAVGVKAGKIVSITSEAEIPDAKEVLDLGGQYLIPGTIDTHMHVRDPGHTERGNFYTETMAAAAGGVVYAFAYIAFYTLIFHNVTSCKMILYFAQL